MFRGWQYQASQGFLLPTVVIGATLLFAALTFALSNTSSMSASLNNHIYDEMANDAAESGMVATKHCLSVGGIGWSDDSPLRPGSDCDGASNCVDADCSLIRGKNYISTFTVSGPKSLGGGIEIWSKGTVSITRSNGTVIKRYERTVKLSTNAAMTASRVVKVATGENHTCSLDSLGKAYCWGYNGYGQLGTGNTVQQKSPVAVTASGVLHERSLVDISAGANHTCAVDSNGKAYCWGYNGYGQLGTGNTTQAREPVAVLSTGALSGVRLVSISAGTNYTCAVDSDGAVYCWGLNNNGQLGTNNTSTYTSPVAITGGGLPSRHVVQIDTGLAHTCALDQVGQVYCWGYNGYGQLGTGNTSLSRVPILANGGGFASKVVVDITVSSYYHTCAVDDAGTAYCWGRNNQGQLGSGSTATLTSPTPLSTSSNSDLVGKTVVDVDAGYYHTCAVDDAGASYCWGYNNNGQLGTGNTTTIRYPTEVNSSGALSEKVLSDVSTGTYFSCAIDTAGKLYCWGQNNYGQLGTGDTSRSLSPTALVSSTAISGKSLEKVATGDNHACLIDDAGKVYCWGQNPYGQLGTNNTSTYTSPVAITGGGLSSQHVVEITAGANHTCAISDTSGSGKVYCWGYNIDGQLGTNNTTTYRVPTAITGGGLSSRDVVKITAGFAHTCVLDSAGKVYCWGKNTNGQLGTNNTTNYRVPTAVTSGIGSKNIVDIAAGYAHTCALDSSGKAYCWGYNGYGQIGIGVVMGGDRPSPQAVSGRAIQGKKLVEISTGHDHTCAIDSSGKAYCWGNGVYGQLGTGSSVFPSAEPNPLAVVTSGALSDKLLVSITAGNFHSCAADTAGQSYCWGHGNYGQLGTGNADKSNSPKVVGGELSGESASGISAGFYYTCAISDSWPYCWGYDFTIPMGTSSDYRLPAVTDTPNSAASRSFMSY